MLANNFHTSFLIIYKLSGLIFHDITFATFLIMMIVLITDLEQFPATAILKMPAEEKCSSRKKSEDLTTPAYLLAGRRAACLLGVITLSASVNSPFSLIRAIISEGWLCLLGLHLSVLPVI